MMASYAIVDAIVEALSKAAPDRRIARSGMLLGYALAGISGNYWIHNSFDFGGTGARIGHDGADATGFHFGVGRNQIPQVEPIEARCEVLCTGVELIADSGGAGRWRGGLGVRITLEVLEDAVASIRTDHFETPPTGIDGGGDAMRSSVYIVDPRGHRTDLPSKAANVPVSKGCLFVLETSGGGGYGRPSARPIEEVARDVVEGRVTPGSARDIYRVEVRQDGAVDEAATEILRSR